MSTPRQREKAMKTTGSNEPKSKVLKYFPDAYCVRCTNGDFIVWPGKIQPRGCEQPAIGYGKTARMAWRSVNTIFKKYLKDL